MNTHVVPDVWSVLPYPALIIDPSDTITECNAATEEFANRAARTIRGQPVARLLGDDGPTITALSECRRGHRSAVVHDAELIWGEGADGRFNLHIVPLEGAAGHLLILCHPHGMAPQLDRALGHRASARAVSGLAAMLAHEIRNPLAGISGAAQLLSMSLEGDAQGLTALIETEARRIGDLVNGFERFGEMPVAAFQPVNIHDVLDRARRAAEAGFARKVEFSCDYDPSLPPLPGDPDALMQVFLNLLKNAAEAIDPARGRITIQTSFQPGFRQQLAGGEVRSLPLQVAIIDNGTGIPASLLADIFDPFVSSKINGSGLGLALVSRIVTAHGGVVDVQSQPGRTAFTLRLPVVGKPSKDQR